MRTSCATRLLMAGGFQDISAAVHRWYTKRCGVCFHEHVGGPAETPQVCSGGAQGVSEVAQTRTRDCESFHSSAMERMREISRAVAPACTRLERTLRRDVATLRRLLLT